MQETRFSDPVSTICIGGAQRESVPSNENRGVEANVTHSMVAYGFQTGNCPQRTERCSTKQELQSPCQRSMSTSVWHAHHAPPQPFFEDASVGACPTTPSLQMQAQNILEQVGHSPLVNHTIAHMLVNAPMPRRRDTTSPHRAQRSALKFVSGRTHRGEQSLPFPHSTKKVWPVVVLALSESLVAPPLLVVRSQQVQQV